MGDIDYLRDIASKSMRQIAHEGQKVASNLDPANLNTPVLGPIRKFNKDVFGTPAYANPNLPADQRIASAVNMYGQNFMGHGEPVAKAGFYDTGKFINSSFIDKLPKDLNKVASTTLDDILTPQAKSQLKDFGITDAKNFRVEFDNNRGLLSGEGLTGLAYDGKNQPFLVVRDPRLLKSPELRPQLIDALDQSIFHELEHYKQYASGTLEKGGELPYYQRPSEISAEQVGQARYKSGIIRGEKPSGSNVSQVNPQTSRAGGFSLNPRVAEQPISDVKK